MGWDPPHLLYRDDNSAEGRVTAVADIDTGTIDVAVRGRWGGPFQRWVHRTLAPCLAEHPTGIVIDLHQLDDPRGDSASLWLTARSQGATMHPCVAVVASLPAAAPLTSRLHRAGARRRMPVYSTVRQAHGALAGYEPMGRPLRLHLPPRPVATVVARHAVAEACSRWRLPQLLHHAQMIVSELVTNAARHAGTPIDVIISRRGANARTVGLHLAVHDRDPRFPELLPSDAAPAPHQPGLGLRIVNAAAHAWGALPTRAGKLVWATVRRPAHPH